MILRWIGAAIVAFGVSIVPVGLAHLGHVMLGAGAGLAAAVPLFALVLLQFVRWRFDGGVPAR